MTVHTISPRVLDLETLRRDKTRPPYQSYMYLYLYVHYYMYTYVCAYTHMYIIMSLYVYMDICVCTCICKARRTGPTWQEQTSGAQQAGASISNALLV